MSDLAGRYEVIDGTLNELAQLVRANPDINGEERATILAIVGIAQIGICSLCEIADAQQRMAAVAEKDFAAAVDAAVGEKVNEALAKDREERNKRNFIGSGA